VRQTTDAPGGWRSRIRRRYLAILTLGLALPTLASVQQAEAAVQRCAGTTGPGGYVVQICLDSPTDGAVLTGTSQVSVTISTSGMPSGVRIQDVVFCLDFAPCSKTADGYLVTDFASVPTGVVGQTRWGFDLDSTLYPNDNSTRILAYAEINDATTTPPAGAAISLANGLKAQPPIPTGFQPHLAQSTDGLVVGAVGDGAGGEPGETAVANLISSWNPGLFVYLGDVYDKGSPGEFTNWYDKYGYGDLKSITNPTIGNHEYSADGTAEGYFRYWRSPPHYYSYDAGGWHFVSLDSSDQFARSVSGMSQDQPSSVPGVATQYDWLAADLAAHQNSCTIAYFHHPVWNQGEESRATRMQAIWALLAGNKVSLVLNGHDHDYQRFAAADAIGNPSATGVTEIVAGGGGHSTQAVTLNSQDGPNPVRFSSGFAAVKLTLHPDRADFDSIAPSSLPGGRLLDSGSVPCQALGPDSVPPSAPVATASATQDGGLVTGHVNWQPATDNRAVSQYQVLRNGSVVSPLLSGSTTSWDDNTVQGNMTYSYVVRAADAWANRTDSAPVSVTTPLPTADPAPAGLLADTYTSSSSPAPKGTATTLRVAQNSSGTSVTYLKFDLRRFSGQIASATLTMVPSASTSAIATSWSVANSDWSESTLGYPGPALGVTPGGSTSRLVAGTPMNIDVKNIVTLGVINTIALTETSGTTTQAYYSREAGSSTAPALTISVQPPPDTQPPSAPTGLTASANGEGPVVLQWSASSDDVGVDHYVIQRDGATLDSVPSSVTAYSDVAVSAGTSYSYDVAAVDRSGKVSQPSNSATATTLDLTPPEAPEDPFAMATSATSAVLVWHEAEDNVETTGYRIFRNGVEIGGTQGTNTTFTDTGLTPGETYTYGIAAYDAAGNVTSASHALADSLTLPSASSDTAGPSAPTGLAVTQSTGNRVTLTWDAAQDDVGVAEYTVFQGLYPIGTATGTSFEVTELTSAETYNWRVDAVDAAGNHSARSTAVTFTTPDAVPPTAPTNLAASAPAYNFVTLNWDAATDNIAVASYAVYRDGVLLTQVSGTTYPETTFTDTTTAPLTQYSYGVAAVDPSGNQSALTTTSLTTPDRQTRDTGWLQMTDAAYVQSGSSADTNYRNATELRVSGGTTPKITYLKFTIDSTNALTYLDHLYVQLNTSLSSAPGFVIHPVTDNSWTRQTITWNNRPGYQSAVVGSCGEITAAGTVPTPPGVIDLASYVTAPGTYSLALTASSSASQKYYSLVTSVAVDQRPSIRVVSHS